MIINVSNAKISQEKLTKLEDTHKPSSVMSIWEKIKDWLGLSNEKKVLTLIRDIYFDKDISIIDKNKYFFELRNLAYGQYKNNFKLNVVDDHIVYKINFQDGYIATEFDIKPFFESIENKLNLNLKNYGNEDLESFINNYSKLSAIKNDNVNYEEKFIAFRATLMECIDNKNKSDRFYIDEFNKKTSFGEKLEYLNNNRKTYSVELDSAKLISNLTDAVCVSKSDNYNKLINMVKIDIPRYSLKYNGENITSIMSLDKKLENLNRDDKMFIFELLNQGVFQIIKNSFEKYDPIATMYSPIDGRMNVDIESNDNKYTITVKYSNDITEENIEKINSLYSYIINSFDRDTMDLYAENFTEGTLTKEKMDKALGKYSNELNKRMDNFIGDKFNYEQKRFNLLTECINLQFEFNPNAVKKLTVIPEKSKIEYDLLKS
ncbi:hypothetical protein [Proteus sp. CD3]|uniref:hypothetical protein n=1 Tax=Proteus sp. CD3 TaxID=1921565 RepID=UPI00124A669B|nr:hypothetical protein [Proteus sp. CD3]QEZ92284.1 hypothetical protein BTA34_07945 [Proteus sp. CD3]